MTGDEPVRAPAGAVRDWSNEQLTGLLVALEMEMRKSMQRAQEGGAETPMDRWWKHGGVMFKDE